MGGWPNFAETTTEPAASRFAVFEGWASRTPYEISVRAGARAPIQDWK